jgi:hypothetical protein
LLAEFAYNNAKHSKIGISPFYAYYRFYPRLEYKVKVDNSSSVLAALKRIKRISLEREALVKCWEYAAEAQAKYYNCYY